MKVTIAIPSYTGQVHIGTFRSLLQGIRELSEAGHTVDINDECGSALIGDTRDRIVYDFLSSDAEALFFVDSDVSWSPGAMLRVLEKSPDMVTGIYPYRVDETRWPVAWDHSEPNIPYNEKTGLIRVRMSPLGFARLSRKMLIAMCDAYPELLHTRPDGAHVVALFSDLWETIDEIRVKTTEDVAFCRRWELMGGEIWVDPEITFGHTGLKTFTGNLGAYLRNR